ncbi:MAG: M15 family metallopeptidase [Actinomycetota bacterium]
MKPRTGLVAAALAGALAGAAIMLTLPVPGVPLEPVSPPQPPAGAVRGAAPVPTLLAWTPGGLPGGFADAVRRLPGVRAAAEVRSGTAWLSAWRDRSGQTQRPPKGFQVPVEVAAVQPAGYTAFVPPADRAAIEALAGGGVLLGETSAGLRGMGSGGTLRFGPRSLRVEGVIADELVGAHEVVVSARTGARLGVTSPPYLLVLPREGASPRAIERGVRRSVPPGTRIRVRAPGETPVFRHGDAVLPPVRLKALFGEFPARPDGDGTITPDPAWVRANIRTARVPILGEIHCHRRIIPLFRAALAELARRGLGNLIQGYAGCFSPRFANFNPTSGLSHHSWGVAFDINAAQNPLGAEPTMDPRMVEVMRRWGFTWGGLWLVPDGMHFEFQRFPSLG